jgi:hypothetical protein
MSAAYRKGVLAYLPNAQISYDRFHIVKLAGEAMDEVRSAEWKDEYARVQAELGELTTKERRSIVWGMRRNPASWSTSQINAMHWLQRANLKTARAWRLKMGLREIWPRPEDTMIKGSPVPISGAGSPGPGAAGSSPSSAWARRSSRTSTPSCAACSITEAMPSPKP